ncbi:MAG: T9SS type A sorting domain-containing protein, partial [Crocinitomicaceae bacterium]|nr:T9SS type A sorting domain-containing protein [Crocinitomicaceae bacterium]
IIVDDPQRQFHNFEATVDAGEAAVGPAGSGCFDYDGWCSGDGVTQTVWFEFTAPTSGAVSVSTFDTLETMTSSNTEIAVYSTPDCSNYGTYVLEGANTFAPLSGGGGVAPFGSEVVMCGLTPGETYYVMVNPVSFESFDIIFGLEIASIDAAPEAGFPANLEACEGEPVDFFNTITGNSSTDGQWYSPSAAPGNEAPSAVSGLVAGSYGLAYVIENACAADTVETILVVSEGPSAGGDGSFTTCNTFDVVLLEHLVGTVELGGTWIDDDATDALFGGLFVTYGLAAGSYNFTYVVEGGGVCPDDSASVVVTLTDCLGEDENELGTLEVFPNPVSDVLTIQNLNIEGNATIELIDAQGKIISTNLVSGIFGNYELDMTELESGMYFVKIVTDNTAQKVRVVKQ